MKTKVLVISTAVSALMLSSAFAQSPTPQSTPAPAQSSTTTSVPAPNTDALSFVASQTPDQFLASKFRGTDVVGTDDVKIGDVSDMLFDKDGRIQAFIVSVGGFLGVGAKDVAVAPSAFTVVKGTASEPSKLKLPATKEQLKQAQNFEPYNPPAATTGSGGTGMNGGVGRPAAPNSAPATTR